VIRRALLLAPFVLAGAVSFAPHASAVAMVGPQAAGTATVDIVKVTGMIDPSEAAYVRGTIEAVEAEGASKAVIVLQIDSLGGYGDQASRLGAAVRAATVPVVGWVGPLGAKAQGGALYLVYGSRLASMAAGAGLGPGRPFDPATRASTEPAAAVATNTGALGSLAPGAGATAAGVRVVVDRPLAAGPARDAGAVALVANDVPSLLRALNGRTVTVDRAPVRLATVSSSDRPVLVRFHEIGPVRRLLHAVGTPVAVYVLLVGGLWAVAFEFTQPGIGLAGIAGVLALALAGYGLWVIPFRWFGLVLIVAGIALQGADVLVRRLAWLTGIGTAVFLAGSVWTWWGVAPAIRVPLWLPVLFTIGGLLLFGFGFTVAVQARERIRSQQVGLVGLTGEVRSDLNPEGGVVVKGTVWRARAMDGPLVKGTKVRVRGIDGLVLQVEPEPGSD
jgi:membrane-bound serine protease (ClpP class)